MATNPLHDALTPATRQKLYVTYGVVGLGLGATQVGYAAADAGQPTALTVALAVFAFIGTGLGFTAASNPTPLGMEYSEAIAAEGIDDSIGEDDWDEEAEGAPDEFNAPSIPAESDATEDPDYEGRRIREDVLDPRQTAHFEEATRRALDE